MIFPDFSIEDSHDGAVCGIDEAGRGPWAGPVVAAAVWWEDIRHVPNGLNDSKKLSKPKREALFETIMKHAVVGVGEATVEEIDQLNILAATKLAMQRAYEQLPPTIQIALVDGNQPPALPCRTIPVIKGDSKSLSIAAASVIAKVTRDRQMEDYSQTYPEYGFEKHAGYGTKAHQDALATFGITPIHRQSFAPIKKLLQEAA